MAVLEKIRVKMGAFITVIIALALLSFIVDPSTLESTLSMFSSKYDVGEINGESVSYQDYQKKVDYFTQIHQLTNGGASNDQTQEMIYDAAWQDEIAERVILPAIADAGLTLGDDEMYDMTQGNNISPVIANDMSFCDENGQFDKARLAAFVQNISQDASGQLAAYWQYLEDNMRTDQLLTKYVSLLEKSNIVNPVDLNKAIANNNTTYNIDFVVKPVGFGIDSTIVVTDSEIKSFYEAHKHLYNQSASKDIEYVVYEVVPSAKDLEYAQNAINGVYPEFTTTDNIKNFMARNSDQPFNPFYFKQEELNRVSSTIADFAKDAKVGDLLEPYQDDNMYVAARIMDKRQMPDSVFVKHILLQGKDADKADSLLNVVKKGGNFAQLAEQFSADQNPNVAEAGDLGWMTQQQMIPGFESVMTMSKNGVAKLTTTYGTHIVKVTDVTKAQPKIQLAILVKEAVASDETTANYYAQANNLASKCEGDIEKFNAAVKEMNLTSYPAMRILPSAKTIANYDKAREVVRWINENNVGSVSSIIPINNQYFFVVAITGAHEEGTISLAEMAGQIKQELTFEKRAEKVAAETKELVNGLTDIEAVAEKLGTSVSNRSGVAFSSLTSQQLDPKFIGAVSTANEGELVGPVVGDMGVYYFVVKGKEVGAFYTEDDARQRKAQEFTFMSRMLPAIMAEGAGVVDQRYKFF